MNENLETISQFLLDKLKIPQEAKMEWAYPISVGERELLLDLVIESKETVTIVEIKSRINEDTIYRIYAFSHLIDKKVKGNKDMRLVCAGKSLKYSTQDIATRLGIEVLLIPPKLYQYLPRSLNASEENSSFERIKSTASRITSEKAWKIICFLLTGSQPNILSISKKTGVSYGWTNSIVHKLEKSGIINSDYGLRINDIDKLLNIASWERSLDGLLMETINTNFSTATQCMNEVAINLNKLGIDYAFTAHSSAVAYGSSIMREDTAYIYLPDPSERKFFMAFLGTEERGCNLKVYVPERDIMKTSTLFNGVRIVNVCQNILDLAGLGMDGRIAAKDLVNRLGH